MHRIVILGAGPAGSTAAFHLARAGHHVTILERAVFPRVKVCGEFISPAATDLLESIIPPDDLLTAGARRVNDFALELGERSLSWPLPAPAWALSRAALDPLLLAKAAAAGANVHQPTHVTGVQYAEDQVIISAAGTQNSTPIKLRADLIIHADGSGRHDPAGPTPNDPRLVGHKCHLRLDAERSQALVGVRMRVGHGSYLGTISVEQGLATCALVAHKSLIARHHADADAMTREMWPAFNPAWRVSDWKSCGVPRSGYVTPGHPRSFRIGNAAAAVDPVGGEGIGLAIWSATELSGLLNANQSEAAGGLSAVPLDREMLGAIGHRFKAAYQRRLRTRLPACRMAAEACMRPGLVRAMWPLLSRPGVSIGPWYRLTGKPA